MTARFPRRPRESLRRIERRARETGDPLERLRYVRNQMDSSEMDPEFQWWPAIKIAAVVAAAIGAALLVWQIR